MAAETPEEAAKPAPTPAPGPGAGRRGSRIRGLGTRLVVLGLLLAAIEFWCRHHLGGPFVALYVVGVPYAVITLLGAIYDLLASEHAWKKVLARGARVIVRWRVLIVAAVVVVVGMLFVSSVRITADDLTGKVDVRLLDARDATTAVRTGSLNKQGLLIRWLPTVPWGTTCWLEVDGYEPHKVTVGPIMGAKIDLDELSVEPSVLVRVPPAQLPFTAEGSIELWEGGPDWTMIASVPTEPGRGSVVLGRVREITDDLVRKWRLDLRRRWPVQATDEWITAITTQWMDPITPSPPLTVRSGVTLAAVFRLRGRAEACSTFPVEACPIIDVELVVDSEVTRLCESFQERGPDSP